MKQQRYGAEVRARTEQVQVRLMPAALGPPAQVKLSHEEKARLIEAAAEHTPEGFLSAFLRDLALEAASHLHEKALATVGPDHAARWVIETAAAECAMLPGEFMRFIALESIGYTRASELVLAARKALADGVLQQDKAAQ
jgi:hypothetical protein